MVRSDGCLVGAWQLMSTRRDPPELKWRRGGHGANDDAFRARMVPPAEVQIGLLMNCVVNF